MHRRRKRMRMRIQSTQVLTLDLNAPTQLPNQPRNQTNTLQPELLACVLDTSDLCCKPSCNDPVGSDRARRIDMLEYVKRVRAQVEKMWESIWEWKFPAPSSASSRHAAINYIHDGLREICRDFQQACG
ncbi:MAG: hypothetical protein Q9191_003230 [Dirinaria sp. TL-2023a]